MKNLLASNKKKSGLYIKPNEKPIANDIDNISIDDIHTQEVQDDDEINFADYLLHNPHLAEAFKANDEDGNSLRRVLS
jgi:hypothetical protein